MQFRSFFGAATLTVSLLSAWLLLAVACSTAEEDDVSLRLTQRERREIDTLVSQEVKLLRPYYDSLCNADFEKNVATTTDSIIQRRLEDELRLRSRIPLEKSSPQ